MIRIPSSLLRKTWRILNSYGIVRLSAELVLRRNVLIYAYAAGDIAYADYWLKEEIQGYLPNTTIQDGFEVYESLLNQYYDEMTPISSRRPYMVGPGNHEANCMCNYHVIEPYSANLVIGDNGGTKDKAHNITYDVSICVPGQTNFTGFINHFRMPGAESKGLGNFWYSFDNGMVHYIQLDTETDLGHGIVAPDEPGGSEGEDSGPFDSLKNAQTNWLQADLVAVNRSKTPWIVVGQYFTSTLSASG
jgi:hypothetical protein